MSQPGAVVFDLGGVLIDWNPRHLYRQLFESEAEMERFLAEVCTLEWNAKLDAGASWSEAIEALSREHPNQADLVRAYRTRWSEMLGGSVPGTLDVLRQLKRAGIPVYALSNWALETYAETRALFPFLDEFDGVVISGEVGVGKPDPAIFRHLCERYLLAPETTVFIDDWERNVEAATRLGFVAIRFRDATQLAAELRALGLPA